MADASIRGLSGVVAVPALPFEPMPPVFDPMPQQFDLPGFEPSLPRAPRAPAIRRQRPQGANNVFFALLPEAGVHRRLLDLQARLIGAVGLTGHPIDAARLHVTLHDLGGHDEPPPEFLAAAKRAADSVSVPPFEVAFDRALSFPSKAGKRPFVLAHGDPLAPLAAFRRELGTALSAAGVWRHESTTPHMTLLYDTRTLPEHPVEPITWPVAEFVLLKSLRGQGIHERLGTWPLRGYAI